VVQRALAPHREALAIVWRERSGQGAANDESESLLAAAIEPVVSAATADALRELYPQATALRENAQPALLPAQ
jgi:hypothetical protein